MLVVFIFSFCQVLLQISREGDVLVLLGDLVHFFRIDVAVDVPIPGYLYLYLDTYTSPYIWPG